MDVIQRFQTKTARGPDDCVTWMGARDRGGYGSFWMDGRMEVAHRAALILHRVDIPEGMDVDHLCGRRACVNPEHLEVVTHAENNRRAAAKITHCPQGHAYDDANTYRDRHGKRSCRACARFRWHHRNARIRGEAEA